MMYGCQCIECGVIFSSGVQCDTLCFYCAPRARPQDKDDEIAALKAEVERLREDNARWVSQLCLMQHEMEHHISEGRRIIGRPKETKDE